MESRKAARSKAVASPPWSDCLAKGVKILDGMKCSPLLAPIPLDTGKSEIQLSSGIIIMLFLLSYEVHIMLNKSI